MKKITFKTSYRIFLSTIYTIASLIILNSTCTSCAGTNNKRDYRYEKYCDSIWFYNTDYYNNVLVKTDKYQDYINKYGKWWEENYPLELDEEEARILYIVNSRCLINKE